MLPVSLHDFLIASVGASASFIGLLFVALTFVMSRADASGTIARKDRVMAESAYMALLAILFISLVGLLPNGNISSVLLIMGMAGFLSTLRPSTRGITRKESMRFIHPILLIIYAVMAVYGFALVTGIAHTLSLTMFYITMFTLYGIALGRAWELSGIEVHE